MTYAIHRRHPGRHFPTSRDFSNREDAEIALAKAMPDTDDTSYWLRVFGVAALGEHERSVENLELARRCDDFVILLVGKQKFIIPKACGITARSAPSQFRTGC
jgi:hypothetical protein